MRIGRLIAAILLVAVLTPFAFGPRDDAVSKQRNRDEREFNRLIRFLKEQADKEKEKNHA